jgi:hypothetical protein
MVSRFDGAEGFCRPLGASVRFREVGEMHRDVEPLAEDVAEKQKAFWDAWQQLQESNAKFLRANIYSLSYYVVSEEHGKIFNKWVEASKALDDAVTAMQERAIDAAGIPADHPLPTWLQSRKRRS